MKQYLRRGTQELRALRRDAGVYYKEFVGRKADKQTKARLERGDGTEEELTRFYRLRQNYNTWQTVLRNSKRPVKPAPRKLTDYTLEERRDLYEKWKAYHREFGGVKNRAKRDRLRSERGPPEEFQRFQDIRDAAKEYVRVRKMIDKSSGKSKPIRSRFTPEELQQLEVLRPDAMAYWREFLNGERSKQRKAQYAAGQAPADAIQRMNKLKTNYDAYNKLLREGRKRGKKRTLEFEVGTPEEIRELEALRRDHLDFNSEFGGRHNQERRKRLEARQGEPEEVDRYHRLHEASRRYNTLYKKLLREAKKRREIKSSVDKGTPEKIEKEKIPREEGRPRYFQERRKPELATSEEEDRPEQGITSNSASETDENHPGFLSTLVSESSRVSSRIMSAAAKAQPSATVPKFFGQPGWPRNMVGRGPALSNLP